jgi:hypothetical protein
VSSSPVASTPAGKLVEVTLQGGGTAQLSLDALLVGQRAARGLFTGSMAGVPVREGAAVPVVLDSWPDPAVGNVEYAIVFPDGSMSLAFPVDPDGAGGEVARLVTVQVVPQAGAWAFDPV